MATLKNINGFPFARLSAEEERSYLKEIFFKQRYYDSLVNLAEASASRFILGQRGIGKSATILHLFEDMKELHLMPILIDQYDEFPERNNKNYFLYAMIVRLIFELAECLLNDKSLNKRLNTTQRNQLGLYIEMFYDPVTASHCIECAESISSVRRINKIKAFINNHLAILNNVIGIFVKVGAELIRNKAGLGDIDISNFGNQYLGELHLTSYRQIPRATIVTWDSDRLKSMLRNLLDIARNFGFASVIMMFDKIDEVQNINGQVEKVTSFMMDFLSDTNLLYQDNLAIVVSLWSEVKKTLNRQGIRFDKFKVVDISWSNVELEKLLNKRLQYFAKTSEQVPTLSSLLPNENEKRLILELADKSPRALLNLLGTILDEEPMTDDIVCFSLDALSKGKIRYCKKFDYTSVQPTRTGKGSDVVTWITRLLRMKVVQFQAEDYAIFYNVKKKKSLSHIETLLKYNLIKDSMMPTDNEEPLYEVADPRIRYLISRGIQSLDE